MIFIGREGHKGQVRDKGTLTSCLTRKKKTSWEGTAHGVVCMLLLKMGEACFNNFTTIKDRQSFYPLFCFVVVLQNCVALHRQ